MRRRLLTLWSGGVSLPTWFGKKVYDTFTNSDGTALAASGHTAETGQAWAVMSTYEGVKVLGNQATRSANGGSNATACARLGTAVASDVSGTFDFTFAARSGVSSISGVAIRTGTGTSLASTSSVLGVTAVSDTGIRARIYDEALNFIAGTGTVTITLGATTTISFSASGTSATVGIGATTAGGTIDASADGSIALLFNGDGGLFGGPSARYIDNLDIP